MFFASAYPVLIELGMPNFSATVVIHTNNDLKESQIGQSY